MVEKVVWISRHELNEKNKEILDRAFGEWRVEHWEKETVNGEKLGLLKAFHPDAKFVVVLPPQLIAELLKHTTEVYRFVVERKVDEQGNAEFIPIGLEKILRIDVVTERVV